MKYKCYGMQTELVNRLNCRSESDSFKGWTKWFDCFGGFSYLCPKCSQASKNASQPERLSPEDAKSVSDSLNTNES